MVRTRKSEYTRRKHAIARRKRTSILGQPQPGLDWHCPYCSQWFSQKRNGPSNHLRFCRAAHHSYRSEHRASPAERGSIASPVSVPGSSGEFLSSNPGITPNDSSESESDIPLIRRRHAKGIQRLQAEDSGKLQMFILALRLS
jgi:hypothetical protein